METIFLTLGLDGMRWILGIIITILLLAVSIKVYRWIAGLGILCLAFSMPGWFILFAIADFCIIQPTTTSLAERPETKVTTTVTYGVQALNEDGLGHKGTEPSAGKCSVEYIDKVWHFHGTVIRKQSSSRIIKCW